MMNFRQGMSSVHQQKIPIRAVVFDYGNVLSFTHLASDVAAMAQVCGMTVERFTPPYWSFRLAYDRADLDSETYWTALVKTDGRTLSTQEIDQLIEIDSKGWSRLNSAAVRWVEQIRNAGLQLALLSNMPADISRYLVAHYEWPALFHHLIFSCDLRSTKPEPQIYRACLERLQVSPEEVLFFDDRPENIEAAVALGIHSVLFDSVEQAVRRVAPRFDIPVPGDGGAIHNLPPQPLLDEP